jgi:dTDP-4-amino-4,6-dideoxygalactose transaminase
MINIFNLNNSAKNLKNIVNKISNKETSWVNGIEIKNFENQIKKTLKTKKEVCTCNSGSDALLLTLRHLKKKNKDIIITTPISYIASSSIAKFLGYEIIYIDIDINNYLLDLDKLDFFLKKIDKKVKARIAGVIFVELFGNTGDLSKLLKICKKNKIWCLGDCAQSLGTEYNNKNSFDYYDFAISSFYPTKIISAYGDGGIIFLPKKFKNTFEMLKNNGHNLADKTKCEILGINSRLDTIQAYVLNYKIKNFKNYLQKNRKNFKLYNNHLKNYLKLPKLDLKSNTNGYLYSFRIDKNLVKNFLNFMKTNGIEARQFYARSLPENKVLKPIIKTDLRITKNCTSEIISIPSRACLKQTEKNKIITVIKKFFYSLNNV